LNQQGFHIWQCVAGESQEGTMENALAGYRVKLVEKRQVAEGTLAFSLEKPAGFEFKPGQAAELMLLDPPETDDEGNYRTFSIVAAPSEPVLTFATRLRDTAFKRVLRDMPLGAAIQLDGPFGSFTLHNNRAKPAAFLAGGIGITPFMSMIRDAAAHADPRRTHLFYSNRRPEDAAFLDELAAIQQHHHGFRLVATMAQMEKSSLPWDGERGVIDAALLRRHLPALNGPIYYIAGPPGMVAAMREMLVKAEVDEDDIRTEDFAGY
jgi:ferredoxin-NADP reductase